MPVEASPSIGAPRTATSMPRPATAPQRIGGPATTSPDDALRPVVGRWTSLRQGVLLLATIATGLVAGFFYAYHVSVTRGLAIVDDATYVEAMTAINATVRNAQFGAGFFGALPLGIAALALHLARPRNRSTVLVLIGVVAYIATLAITAGISIPLNNELAVQANDSGADLAHIRAAYETAWNDANAARTATNLAAFTALASALVQPRRMRDDGYDAPGAARPGR